MRAVFNEKTESWQLRFEKMRHGNLRVSTIDEDFLAAYPDAQPVVIRAGALGLGLPKQDIAKMIGASREMVSRVMKDLQMGGYIEMRGSTIVVRDTIMLPD